MLISDIDAIVDQVDPPTRETIESQRQKQLDALKDLRSRLMESTKFSLGAGSARIFLAN